MTNATPWLYQQGQDRKRLYFIMHRISEVLRIGGILAQPFMPVKAKEMLDALGVADSRRTMKNAAWRADLNYGGQDRSGSDKAVHLFPRLEDPESEPTETMEELMKRRREEKLSKKATAKPSNKPV
jgi:methionyl-tRNA synthetase